MKTHQYQPKTGARCGCNPGQQRDNCPNCEGTGWVIDFRAIRERVNQSILPSVRPPPITPLELSGAEIELCERAAKRIGYTQTAYTSTSGLWGLFCLPNRDSQRNGCFIKTQEFGIMFVADLEDLQLHDLAEEARKL